MGPKVRAAVRFLRHGGEVAVITSPELVYASLEGTVSQLEGTVGTRIVRVRPTGRGAPGARVVSVHGCDGAFGCSRTPTWTRCCSCPGPGP